MALSTLTARVDEHDKLDFDNFYFTFFNNYFN